MVNAILWSPASALNNVEETGLVIRYIQQLHSFHGFDTIFVPEDTYSRIRKKETYRMDYLRRLPNPPNRSDELIAEIRCRLDSILWELKRTDHIEAQLTSFISLYSKWIHARLLEAVVVLPMTSPTSPVSRFFHTLTGDQREFIKHLADDLELWFLSRFADIRIRWPHFLDFPEEIEEIISARFDLDKLKHLRTEICEYPTGKQEEQTRKKLLQEALELNGLIMEFATKNYRGITILTQSAIGVSNRNLLAFERLNWHYSELMKILQEPFPSSKRFLPCFIPDKLYSLEVVRKIEPLNSLQDATNPLEYYATFELVHDKNVDLALKSFERRLGVKHTS